MKVAPLNILQLLLAIAVVACPSVGADWPSTAAAMQVTTAIASGLLATVSLYAPPMAPTTIVTTLLGPSGVQTIHVLQATIGAIVTTVAGLGAANPSLGHVVQFVSAVGGILMGVFGIVSPKALNGPVMAMRLRRANARTEIT